MRAHDLCNQFVSAEKCAQGSDKAIKPIGSISQCFELSKIS